MIAREIHLDNWKGSNPKYLLEMSLSPKITTTQIKYG